MANHLWTDDTETYVAETVEEAAALFREQTGDDPREPLEMIPDEPGRGEKTTKPAGQWAAEQPKGFLCSTEC